MNRSAADFCRGCFIAIIAGLLVACTPPISPDAVISQSLAPADFPEAYYRQAALEGRRVMRIDSNRSLVTIIARRGGALARLGHDHVVASHDVRGYVDVDVGRADLYVALDRLAVDEPNFRAEAGLTIQPSLEAVEGTRRNMLEKVLDAQQFPFALIRVIRDTTGGPMLQVTITLHGTGKTFEVPAQIENLVDGIRISGQMAFNQTDFGMTPFSVLGGAIQVQDRLDLRFKIYAGRN